MYTNRNSMVEGGPAGVQAGKWTTGTDVGSLIPGDSLSVYSKHSAIWLQATIIAIPSVLCVVAAWAREGCFPCLHHPPIHTWGRWKSWPWAPKESCPCCSSVAALGRGTPTPHLWNTMELALKVKMWKNRPWVCESRRTGPTPRS